VLAWSALAANLAAVRIEMRAIVTGSRIVAEIDRLLA
jgi:hypothetical protein